MRKLMYAFVALALLVIVVLAVYARTATRPSNLGVENGSLAACPDSPNCVSSRAKRESQQIAPFTYSGKTVVAMSRLREIVEAFPRARIVTQQGEYMHVEFTSAVFRFVDDAEFLNDPAESVIHIRSASRVGHSDLGANRRRVEQIRKCFGP